MIDYETRLVAALRSYGADDRVVDEARATLQDFSTDDEMLVRELGEPEAYAQSLMPHGRPRQKVTFIVAGLVLAILAWMALKWADESGQGRLDGLGPAQYLLPPVILAAGIFAEFWRYLRQGRR